MRPTSDRVREAIFDVLFSLSAVVDASVLDLFAGTGALGIEAASRGCAAVTFVESDRKVAEFIEANLERTGLAESVNHQVIVADALVYSELSQETFDLALIDPPYRFDGWEKLLAHVKAGLIVCESSSTVDLGEAFALYRVYRYGTTLVTVATRNGRDGSEAGR